MWNSIKRGEEWKGELYNKRKNGEIYPVETSISPIFDNIGKPVYYVAQQRDITDEVNQREELERLARTDTLTGLYKREYLIAELSKRLTKAKHCGDLTALLFMDLDGFKQVNDEFGHNYGDMVLVETAKRISSVVKKNDLVARFGGDEFLVYLENLPTTKDANNVAQRIITTINNPYDINGIDFRIGVSIGICNNERINDVDDMITCADNAMYKAKRAGKGTFR